MGATRGAVDADWEESRVLCKTGAGHARAVRASCGRTRFANNLRVGPMMVRSSHHARRFERGVAEAGDAPPVRGRLARAEFIMPTDPCR